MPSRQYLSKGRIPLVQAFTLSLLLGLRSGHRILHRLNPIYLRVCLIPYMIQCLWSVTLQRHTLPGSRLYPVTRPTISFGDYIWAALHFISHRIRSFITSSLTQQ